VITYTVCYNFPHNKKPVKQQVKQQQKAKIIGSISHPENIPHHSYIKINKSEYYTESEYN
jgi:hypothetical protein